MPAPATTNPASAKAIPTTMTIFGKSRNAFMLSLQTPVYVLLVNDVTSIPGGWDGDREETTTVGEDGSTICSFRVSGCFAAVQAWHVICRPPCPYICRRC